ncbi:MAG: hypothetical protein AB7O97_04880 [Planctomycetota bacterium]
MRLQLVHGRAIAQVIAVSASFWTGAASAAQEGSSPDASPPASPPVLATVLVDGAELRCWPTANSPHYEDALAKDAALRTGRLEQGFREVLLPIGPVGYVHKKFASEPKDGAIHTNAKGVAFRYRPQSGEAPVTSLAEGTELFVIGEDGEWWRVRHPGVVGWLPDAELQLFPTPPETVAKAWSEFEKTQRGQVQAHLDRLAAAAAAAELADQRRQQFGALQQNFQQELQKPTAEQQLDPIESATDELLAGLDETSALTPMVQELKRRIGAQRWVIEATAVRDAEPVPATVTNDLPPAVVADPLDRFQSVGFLRWEKGLTGPGRFVVEKGGQRLMEVTCRSGRYDLSLFTDCEIGLVGARRRPDFESLRVLDVEKIEVLAPRN